jgi:hypothetical protein
MEEVNVHLREGEDRIEALGQGDPGSRLREEDSLVSGGRSRGIGRAGEGRTLYATDMPRRKRV